MIFIVTGPFEKELNGIYQNRFQVLSLHSSVSYLESGYTKQAPVPCITLVHTQVGVSPATPKYKVRHATMGVVGLCLVC